MSLANLPTTSNTSKTFKDPHHFDGLLENFEKFHEDEQFLDVALVSAVDQIKVKAHRIVLSAASDYFMAMFSSPLKESSADEIELNEIDGTTLLSIVEFIYSGNITLHADTVENIVRAADFLQMHELVTVCCVFMSEHIDDANCLGISVFAEHLNYTELFEKASSFACRNFSEVVQEKEFLELPVKQLIRLISTYRDEQDGTVDEETVFYSIADWYAHDKVNRESSLFDLLSLIKFELLTAKFIIENRHAICPLVECYEMILSWVEWHLSPENCETPSPSPSPTPSPSPAPSKAKTDPNKRFGKKRKNIVLALPGGTTTINLRAVLFKIQSNTWTEVTIPRCPVFKESFGVIVINEQLIIVGGKNDHSSLYNVESMDLMTNEWSTMPSMAQQRHSCAVAELNDNIYVVGGYSRNICLASVEKYDFESCKWTFVASLPETMRIVNLAVLNGVMYAIDVGGNSMYCYDPSTNEWTAKTFKQEESRFFGIAAAYGYLFAFGGYINGKPTDTVERYNPLDDEWELLDPMEEERSGIKCSVVNNRILTCGGRTENGLTNQVDEYNPRLDVWKTLAPMPLVIDGRAKIFSL